MYYDKARTDNIGSLDASGANTVAFAPGQPVDVTRIVLVTTVAHTTADATITVTVRDVDDGNSTTVGTFALAYDGSATDDVQYVNVAGEQVGPTTASDGSIVYGPNPGVIEVNPGQEIALTSDGGGDAGTYQVYVEYFPQGFTGARVAHAVEVTMTFA